MSTLPTWYGTSQNNGISYDLWKDCPWLSALQDPGVGYGIFDDFLDLPTGKYTATQATAGTFALDDAAGGVALADCNSTTVVQGINVQLNSTTGEIFTPAAGKTLWFETRIKIADTATGPELFVGLHEIDTTIIATSALSGSNMIGFSSVTDNNVILFVAEKATAANTEACTTMVDDTWINLGFKVYEDAGALVCDQWINGVQQASTTQQVAANIPVVAMTPSFVCQSGGTTDPILHIDWYRCFQLR